MSLGSNFLGHSSPPIFDFEVHAFLFPILGEPYRKGQKQLSEAPKYVRRSQKARDLLE